jgi:cell division protease FtsH
MSEKEKLITAYHEGGHALVGHVLPHADPIHKVSIVARGRALGWTLSLPLEDKYTYTRNELRDRIAVLMGGRSAEEMIFGDYTTGAANDIEKASEIARAMVTQYGMSDILGPQKLGQQQGEVFLGREFGHQANYSDEVAASIDNEIRAFIDGAHSEARHILEVHRATLDALAAALMERETLDTPDLMEILGELPPWPGLPSTGSTKARRPKPRAATPVPKALAANEAAAPASRRKAPRVAPKPATA